MSCKVNAVPKKIRMRFIIVPNVPNEIYNRCIGICLHDSRVEVTETELGLLV